MAQQTGISGDTPGGSPQATGSPRLSFADARREMIRRGRIAAE
jgi:hypothetical protein